MGAAAGSLLFEAVAPAAVLRRQACAAGSSGSRLDIWLNSRSIGSGCGYFPVVTSFLLTRQSKLDSLPTCQFSQKLWKWSSNRSFSTSSPHAVCIDRSRHGRRRATTRVCPEEHAAGGAAGKASWQQDAEGKRVSHWRGQGSSCGIGRCSDNWP